ncbi:MAG TPA: hypothetical protein VJQ09_07250 [Candidatus Limnocylindria bacterium]|nr:hypothetical protein [Candidatus Limnocylindria bacterium]
MRLPLVLAVAGLGILVAIAAILYASAQESAPATPPGLRQVPAPIDRLDVVVRDSQPPQVTLKVTAGLPSGCAKRDSYSVKRSGDAITVSVLNTMPTGDPICTMIYGTYDLTIDLGTEFRAGTTYTVRVNEKTTTFRA